MKLPPPALRIGLYVAFFIVALGLLYVQYRAKTGVSSELPNLGRAPKFSLTTQDRESFTTEKLHGRVTIADFIFTSCAGPCPLMSATMQKMQSTLAGEGPIFFLSFSVDPEFDTPAILRDYGMRFGARPDRWTFLTGDKASISDLTRNGFHLALEADSDAIAHSTKFVLLDKSANIRGYYDSEDDSALILLQRDAVALTRE